MRRDSDCVLGLRVSRANLHDAFEPCQVIWKGREVVEKEASYRLGFAAPLVELNGRNRKQVGSFFTFLTISLPGLNHLFGVLCVNGNSGSTTVEYTRGR